MYVYKMALFVFLYDSPTPGDDIAKEYPATTAASPGHR